MTTLEFVSTVQYTQTVPLSMATQDYDMQIFCTAVEPVSNLQGHEV